jgi:hypothetical protein
VTEVKFFGDTLNSEAKNLRFVPDTDIAINEERHGLYRALLVLGDSD